MTLDFGTTAGVTALASAFCAATAVGMNVNGMFNNEMEPRMTPAHRIRLIVNERTAASV
jgi:hypothetical protein